MRKQLIVELDEPLARERERVAPARSRRRSAFVRSALRRALDEAAEARMTEAYEAQPDAGPAHFAPRVWEPGPGGSPIERGSRIATLKLFIDEGDKQRPWGKYPVVALEAVPVAGFIGRVWDSLRMWLQ